VSCVLFIYWFFVYHQLLVLCSKFPVWKNIARKFKKMLISNALTCDKELLQSYSLVTKSPLQYKDKLVNMFCIVPINFYSFKLLECPRWSSYIQILNNTIYKIPSNDNTCIILVKQMFSSKIFTYLLREWVSDCCLMPTQQFFSAISWQEQVNFQWDDDDICFVLDQHAELGFL
jgi:hypothetical protein